MITLVLLETGTAIYTALMALSQLFEGYPMNAIGTFELFPLVCAWYSLVFVWHYPVVLLIAVIEFAVAYMRADRKEL